jgi:hypothetical protein
MRIKVIAILATAIIFLVGIGAQQNISSQITSKVKQEMPNASGISASVPFVDMPSNLISDSIKSANITIKSFALKESGTKTSLDVSLSRISKAKPTLIGSLEINATIPESTITQSSNFNDAEIVGNTLNVSVGADGMGTASLIPKYSDNEIYFELQSVTVFGNEIPASFLPEDLKNEIRNRSQRDLTPPKGLKVESVSLSSKGLTIKMFGSDIQLGSLGANL